MSPGAGPVSFVSQSGNLGTQLLSWAENQGIGISKFMGSGNEAFLSAADYLDYLMNDSHTGIILLYLEDSGGGRDLLHALLEHKDFKPVIALKGGRTPAGKQAALSHSGAMGSEAMVYSGAMRQAGVIQAWNPSELLNLAVGFAYVPIPRGPRIGIISMGGGWGVVTADECNEAGFMIPPLPARLVERFDRVLPSYWSRANPVDLLGQLDGDLYMNVIEGMVREDTIDAVIVLGVLGFVEFVKRSLAWTVTLTTALDEKRLGPLVADLQALEKTVMTNMALLMRDTSKPIVGVSLRTRQLDEVSHLEDGLKLVSFSTPEKAVNVLAKLLEFGNHQRDIISSRKGI